MPAPFSPTIATTVPAGNVSDTSSRTSASCPDRRTTRARSGCPAASVSGARQIRCSVQRRRVILEPGQASRAIHPEAAQEADLADGRADVQREPSSPAASTSRTSLGGRVQPDRRRTRQRRHTPARRPPTRACATAPMPHRERATGRYQRSQASRRSAQGVRPMPVTRTSFPGGAVVADREQMTRQPLDCAPRSCAARSTAGSPRRGQHRRHARTRRAAPAPDGSTPAGRRSRRAAGSTRRSRTATCTCDRARTPDRAASPGDRGYRAAPGARWSRSKPAAARRATSSAIVTLSRNRRWTRVLTVRRNQVAVAETPRPTADRKHQSAAVVEHALAEQHQPQREQRIGQAPPAATARTRPASAAARDGSRACRAATSTTAPAADRRSPATSHQRTSCVSSSSSSASVKRCACRSNIVR